MFVFMVNMPPSITFWDIYPHTGQKSLPPLHGSTLLGNLWKLSLTVNIQRSAGNNCESEWKHAWLNIHYYSLLVGGTVIASTGKRKYGKCKYATGHFAWRKYEFAGLEYASTENDSIPVNTNWKDYNGTPIDYQMSISLSGFLSTLQWGTVRTHDGFLQPCSDVACVVSPQQIYHLQYYPWCCTYDISHTFFRFPVSIVTFSTSAALYLRFPYLHFPPWAIHN